MIFIIRWLLLIGDRYFSCWLIDSYTLPTTVSFDHWSVIGDRYILVHHQLAIGQTFMVIDQWSVIFTFPRLIPLRPTLFIMVILKGRVASLLLSVWSRSVKAASSMVPLERKESERVNASDLLKGPAVHTLQTVLYRYHVVFQWEQKLLGALALLGHLFFYEWPFVSCWKLRVLTVRFIFLTGPLPAANSYG